MFDPAGQIIGHMNQSRSVRDVMQELVTKYVEWVKRPPAMNAAE
jgi:hypothetical protein